ncbi:MAG TPA: hypothetical protein VF703_07175 [Pyrinomonadaceae bacterium]
MLVSSLEIHARDGAAVAPGAHGEIVDTLSGAIAGRRDHRRPTRELCRLALPRKMSALSPLRRALRPVA